MPNRERTGRVWTRDLANHPAVQAWLTLRPTGPVPKQVTGLKSELKKNKKSAVFRLDGVGPEGANVIAKRCRAWIAGHEHALYQDILPAASVPVPDYFGLVSDPDAAYRWLFLESVEGVEFSSDQRSHRILAAQWLADLHTRTQQLERARLLPERNASHYLEQLHLARQKIDANMGNAALTGDDRDTLRGIQQHLDVLESRWSLIEAATRMMPATLVHGDFTGKNIRLRQDEGRLQLLAFDWEWSGWGYPGVDFFSLTELEADDYWSRVREQWPAVDLTAVQTAIQTSWILRDIASVHWASHSLRWEWLARPMGEMRLYEKQLGQLLAHAKA